MRDGPIETFLTDLGHHLGRDADVRDRILTEVGDHLRELAREGVAGGLDEIEAESAAVERFGAPRALARGLRPPPRRARRALVLLAAAGAIGCGALALSDLRTTGRPAPVAAAVAGGRATAGTSSGCSVRVGAPAGQRQGLILVATEVEMDPRTGRILSCRPVAGLGPSLRQRAFTTGAVFQPSPSVRGATTTPVLTVAARSPFG